MFNNYIHKINYSLIKSTLSEFEIYYFRKPLNFAKKNLNNLSKSQVNFVTTVIFRVYHGLM